MRLGLILALALIVSCRKTPDLDGDGYTSDVDCDDQNAAVNPGATEICNLIDDDCDGNVDNNVTDAPTWYADADNDGYGDAAAASTSCTAPAGTSANAGDCDDANAAIHPGAAETDCTDPVDYNCDRSTGYSDNDNDGFAACVDCDDSDPTINPDGIEVCNGADDDCNGAVDDGATDVVTWYADLDGDGHGTTRLTVDACEAPAGYAADPDDCDDFDPTAYPGAAEICDGRDSDCNGIIDDNPIDPTTFYADGDGDGWGDEGAPSQDCKAPANTVLRGGDCDDNDARIHPSAPEIDCSDPVDYNCDGATGFSDADHDGFAACKDCDDTRDTVHPGATETCDGLDDDCNGTTDDNATNATTWYGDLDGDGHGSTRFTVKACAAPAGYVASSDDCDDLDPTSYPGGTEVCDGADNDCDGTKDNGAIDDKSFYPDTDSDGHGAGTATLGCTAPSGYAGDNTDCDDTNPAIYPGAPETSCSDPVDYNCDGVTGFVDADSDTYAACKDCDDTNATVHPGAIEVCDGLDDDCNGTVDVGATDATVWYRDLDADGHGDVASSVVACAAPTGYVASSDDCDDLDKKAHPGGVEVCDGVDNDCAGGVDNGVLLTFYKDADSDGYGDSGSTKQACTAPSGYVANNTDCNDGALAVHPGQFEVCNGVDDNCDGTPDNNAVDASTFYLDADNDGHGTTGTTKRACSVPSGYAVPSDDCNDGDKTIFGGAPEYCDGVDHNCNTLVNEASSLDAKTFYTDADGDTYGNAAAPTKACAAGAGYVSNATDCDDGSKAVNPAATEICNGIDDNCDTVKDSGQSGGDAVCAATSCKAILTARPGAPNGTYYLLGATTYQTTCDMTTNGGGWTLAAKMTGLDAQHWVTAKTDWTSTATYGSTTSLAAGADAKSEAWGRVTANEFMMTDDKSGSSYVATTSNCLGGATPAAFFTTALATFPWPGDNYFKTCTVARDYWPGWAAEPKWAGNGVGSTNISLNTNYLVIARTDAGQDTSGVISFYNTGYGEADVGLGAMEDGAAFSTSVYQRDIGGPTSCGYNDAQCAADYPQTVFFWVK